MSCHAYNKQTVKVPLPTPAKEFQYKKLEADELAKAFLDFYHRLSIQALPVKTKTRGVRYQTGNTPKSSDTVILTQKQIKGLLKDAEVSLTMATIRKKLKKRIKEYTKTLKCNQKGCFTDAGVEISTTERWSSFSYAFGHFSIYWWAECHVGPRKCDKNQKNCKKGEGSSAQYQLKIKYAIYDKFDFTGWQNIIYTKYLGTDFHIYGEFEHKSSGTTKYCAKPKHEYGKPCGSPLSFVKNHDILYAIQPLEEPCIKPALKDYLDSAMGRIYQEGKEVCSLYGCSNGEKKCLPVLSEVELTALRFYEKPINQELKECLVKVRIAAEINCHCQGPFEKVWPKPIKIKGFK